MSYIHWIYAISYTIHYTTPGGEKRVKEIKARLVSDIEIEAMLTKNVNGIKAIITDPVAVDTPLAPLIELNAELQETVTLEPDSSSDL